MLGTDRSRLPVAIAGAGVAGLSLAIRLRQAGHAVDVLESRSREALGEGAFLTLAPNGMNALKPLGVCHEVARAGIATIAIEILDHRGRRLALMDQRDHLETFGAGSVTILRGRLNEILLAKAQEAGASVHFDSAVSQATDTCDGVTVATARGGERRYRLLAACDGLRSQTRKLVFPEFPQPHFTGLIGTGGIAQVPTVRSTGGTMRMTFGREAFFGYMKEDGQPAYWFNSYPAAQPSSQRSDPHARAARIRALHAADPAPNQEILAAVQEIERDYPIFDMPELPVWHRGNVVLVGDAAHAVGPHAGQGASMAIEDAIVLAACLEVEPGAQAAFLRYERLRRERVMEVVRLTARNASQKKAGNWLSLFVRNLILPVVIPIGARAARRFCRFRVDLDPLAMPG